ncbi:MAG: hypothetical protein ABID45_04570 [Patescibacteria group bacterium]
MLNNFLITITLLAQVSGLTLPQILLEDDFYLAPNFTVDNELKLEVEPLNKIPTEKGAPVKITDENGPDSLGAFSAIAVDRNTEKILWEKNADTVNPIASITKLMTALVFLDHNPSWDHKHKISPQENYLIGARLNASNDEEFSTFNLFRTALVGSRNNAAMALAHSTEMSDDNFTKLMNDKAVMLSMKDSSFVEPTGLEAGNKSSVKDLVKLAKAAFSRDVIVGPMQMATHEMKREGSDEVITIKNTNKLIKEGYSKIVAGKTGYTEEAGFCFLSLAENEWGDEIIVAVLGVPDDDQRFWEAKEIIDWVFNNYKWN